jgi:1,4-alpha-glucan branching enzyme
MMADALLSSRLDRFLDEMSALAALSPLCAPDDARLARARRAFDLHGADLAPALAALPSVELITTSATHAFLPGLLPVPGAADAQVRAGLGYFERRMGFKPRGFWLPECGYAPGLGRVLRAEGVEYTFVEGHGLAHARPLPPWSIYAPVRTPAGLALFGRDPGLSSAVWSAESGYPGHAEYREFHRDIADEPDAPDAVREHVRLYDPSGRAHSGLKPWSIGGAPYSAPAARARAMADAADFASRAESLLAEVAAAGCPGPVAVAAFDAELFGHWWAEGPDWLARVLGAGSVRTLTASGALDGAASPLHECAPGLSSWGRGGYGGPWSDPPEGSGGMQQTTLRLTREFFAGLPRWAGSADASVLQSAWQSLMLMQSSDWAFLAHGGSAPEYARARFAAHSSCVRAFMRAMSGDGEPPGPCLSTGFPLPRTHGLLVY